MVKHEWSSSDEGEVKETKNLYGTMKAIVLDDVKAENWPDLSGLSGYHLDVLIRGCLDELRKRAWKAYDTLADQTASLSADDRAKLAKVLEKYEPRQISEILDLCVDHTVSSLEDALNLAAGLDSDDIECRLDDIETATSDIRNQLN